MIWNLLSTITTIPGVGLGDSTNYNTVFSQVTTSLSSPTATKSEKLDILNFLSTIFNSTSTSPSHVSTHLPTTLPLVKNTSSDSWYKIASASIAVMGSACKMLSSSNNHLISADMDDDESKSSSLLSAADMSLTISTIYEAIEPALAAHDQDQEIKEAAISAVGELLIVEGDNLDNDQKENCLELLYLRLSTDTTRMASLRTLMHIATSVNLTTILPKTVEDCGHFLRQNNRSLIHLSLETLSTLMKTNSDAVLSFELFR